MKKLLLFLVTLAVSLTASGQFLAKMEVKEPIPGLCNAQEVYVLLPAFKGQVQAVCPVSKERIQERLNSEVSFLKDNPNYSDKGMIGLVINCKGEVVQCKMDNKTSSLELDKQVEDVFSALGEWQAGKLKKRQVDTSRLFSFRIEKGQFLLD